MNPATEHPEEKLLDYAYGELAEGEASAIEAHLRSCPRCAESVSETKRVRRTMAQLPMAAAPAAGLDSLLAYAQKAARAARAKPPRSAPWVRWLGPIAGVAALSVVLVISSKVILRRETPAEWARPPEGLKQSESPGMAPPPAAALPVVGRDIDQSERAPPARNDEENRKAKGATAREVDRAKKQEAHAERQSAIAQNAARAGDVESRAKGRVARAEPQGPGGIASGIGGEGVDAKAVPSAFAARPPGSPSSPATEASTIGHEQEVAQLRLGLGTARGQERARLLKRLCDALDALKRESEADAACDALVREFPASDEAKAALERRELRAAEPRR